jgi:RNA polymerase sigma-70 factor, ECF subfamily
MARVFAEHAYFVKRSLRRLGITACDADDALQQVFLVVARRFDEYLAVGSKRGWLFGVSELVSRNYHRGRRRALRRHRWLVALPAFDLEEVLRRREAVRIVSKFLEGLKESERAAFYLADVEGLTAKEIAVELDVNMNTIYSRLRAARRRFNTVLARLP